MEYTFTNKIFDQEQQIELNNDVITFIGGNGSGKSSILEAIFQKYIEDDDARVICFSSGQNELFTEIFQEHRRRNRRHLNKESNDISSFYFNKEWVRLLVFNSTMFRSDGLVRKYLLSRNYINVSDENLDVSTQLIGRFRIRKSYADIIKADRIKEQRGEVSYDARGQAEGLLSYSDFHKTIEKIIDETWVQFDFDTDQNLFKTGIRLDHSNVYSIFQDGDENKLFSFWAHATNGYHSHFEFVDFKLVFEDGKEFKYLSDGEYQLLAIYALIDLFDNENTLFLLDEIDSHLYYENLKLMWKELKSIQGNVITTTHISESILSNNVNNLKYILDGKIHDGLKFKELSERLSSVTGKRDMEYKILSLTEHAVLIDDHLDWRIFKQLARKKLGEHYNEKIEDILPIKKSSGFSPTESIMGRAKLDYILGFDKLIGTSPVNTKNIFLICDLDDGNRNQIQADLNWKIDKSKYKFGSSISIHLNVWRRREVENYLLSYSMLLENNKLDRLTDACPNSHFSSGINLDDNLNVANLDCKPIVKDIYKVPEFDETLFQNMIQAIPENEISEDIVTMHNFISSKL